MLQLVTDSRTPDELKNCTLEKEEEEEARKALELKIVTMAAQVSWLGL